MLTEMHLAGVRIDVQSSQPMVLLREAAGDRYLPIWVGQPEATSIAMAIQGVEAPRPMTHDLLRDVLRELGVTVASIAITELRDGTFYATISLSRNGTAHEVSSRPSDAIALAVRLGCRILAATEVLDEAGIQMEGESGEGEEEAAPAVDPAEAEAELERFRRFLQEISPEDFEIGR